MDSGRYAHSCSLSDNRTCCIAACADCDIRLKALDYLLCSAARCHKIGNSFGISSDILDRNFSLESCYFYSLKLISCFRYELRLHSLWSSCEKELSIGIFFLYYICNSKTGIYMSACSATGYEYSHNHAPFGSDLSDIFCIFFLGAFGFSSG